MDAQVLERIPEHSPHPRPGGPGDKKQCGERQSGAEQIAAGDT